VSIFEDLDRENDHSCIGMTLNTQASVVKGGQILDFGATYHKTYLYDHLVDTRKLTEHSKITLPNGHFSKISLVRKVKLTNSLVLNEVLYVPSFKYDLLSISRLIQDTKCVVVFYPTVCISQELDTKKILGIGRPCQGLYFCQSTPIYGIDNKIKKIHEQPTDVCYDNRLSDGSVERKQLHGSKVFELWHRRLGHAPYNRLHHIKSLHLRNRSNKVCVTCPMAKFVKLPYQLS